jgi:hypothetical protein
MSFGGQPESLHRKTRAKTRRGHPRETARAPGAPRNSYSVVRGLRVAWEGGLGGMVGEEGGLVTRGVFRDEAVRIGSREIQGGFDGEYIPTTHGVSVAKFRQCVFEARMRVLKGRTVMIRDVFTA